MMPQVQAKLGNDVVIDALFAELSALGVQEFCVAAGARNAALLTALLVEDSEAQIYHFFEERCAAFFALGRSMKTRRPVAVVTTSGTAVAELLPAVMEAHYQSVPLVLITADRPSCYRGSGAPQAVEQVGIFGGYVTWEVGMEFDTKRVRISDRGAKGSGPIHFNVCLEEGLSAPPPFQITENVAQTSSPAELDRHLSGWQSFFETEGSLLVVAAGIHPDDLPVVREFLLHLQAPIIAEATSNLENDPALASLILRGGEKALAAFRAEKVLRIGAVPSWRWWRDLEDQADVLVMNVSTAPFRGLARTLNVATVPWAVLADSRFSVSDVPKTFALPTFDFASPLTRLLKTFPEAEPAYMRHLSRLIGAKATIFVGNSLPIREWNLAALSPKNDTVCFANRGANGIDGLVSTWLGVSAEADESWLIIGDLSTLYDLSAPWILSQLPTAKRRIVIINNGGGKIFSRVAWLKNASAEVKKTVENAHAMSFEPWAKLWNLDYRLFTTAEELRDDDSAAAVWEIRPDAAQTDTFWKEWQKVSA